MRANCDTACCVHWIVRNLLRCEVERRISTTGGLSVNKFMYDLFAENFHRYAICYRVVNGLNANLIVGVSYTVCLTIDCTKTHAKFFRVYLSKLRNVCRISTDVAIGFNLFIDIVNFMSKLVKIWDNQFMHGSLTENCYL